MNPVVGAAVIAIAVGLTSCGGGGSDESGDPTDDGATPEDDASAEATESESESEPAEPTPTGQSTSTTRPPPDDPADLIMLGGPVITVDADGRVVDALAVDDGRFVAVGSEADVMAFAGPDTRVVDLGGRSVMPGIVDPHVHYIQNQTPDLGLMVEDQRLLLENGRTTVGIPAVIAFNMAGFDPFDLADLEVLRMHFYLGYNNSCGELNGDYWREFEFDRSAELRIAIAGVKLFTDGGLCNAPAVSWEYPDTPIAAELQVSGTGDLYVTVADVAAVVADVESRDGLTVIHAIGDAAIAVALDGLEAGLAGAPNVNGHRIDHNVIVAPDLYSRYGEIGITPVVWGNFSSCRELDGRGWVAIVPADKLPWLRATSDLMAANPGLRVSFHSDVPSGWLDMFEQLWGIVTLRQREEGTGRICAAPSWLEGHGVPVSTALEMMTINAAHAMDLEHDIGSIEVGKIADVIVILQNPLDQAGDRLLDNSVEATLIEGAVVYCSPGNEGWCDEVGLSGLGGELPATEETEVQGEAVPIVSVRASRVDPNFAIEWVADGVSDSGGWVSGSGAPQWIELDLGVEVDVERLVLWVDQDPGGFTDHRVLGGLEPDPTDELARLSGDTDWGQRLQVEIGRTVRYLRVETVTSPSWVAWLEILVISAE